MENAKEVIGVASKGAGDALKELMKRFLNLKEKQEKHLLEFKTDIRSQKSRSERGKIVRKWTIPRRNEGRRGRPYSGFYFIFGTKRVT